MVQLEVGLPEGHRLDSVDTIWQCTVPSSSIRHMGPNTSLALAPGTSTYSRTAATEEQGDIWKQQIKQSLWVAIRGEVTLTNESPPFDAGMLRNMFSKVHQLNVGRDWGRI